MSDIRQALELMPMPERAIGKTLIEFYETMKALENKDQRGGLQATKIVMTIGEIEEIFKNENEDGE